MVVFNEKYQIIDNLMEDSIVTRKRGGGCIVKHPPVFSNDANYVYILSGQCVSAYSVQTGECVHQFSAEPKEDLSCLAAFKIFLFSTLPNNNLIIWNTIQKSHKIILELKLEEHTTNGTVVGVHPVACDSQDGRFNVVVIVRQKLMKGLQVFLYSNKLGLKNLYTRAEDTAQSVSACAAYVAAFRHDRLTVVPLNTNEGETKTSLLVGGGRWWTAVACAPEGRGLAAGDNTGRILYWREPRHSRTRAVFHWHTLPVNTITFSPSGSYMYSGGGEGVMVRWNVEVSNVRNFLPRLPAPILHLAVSPDSQYVAIATQDNGIHLADTQNRVTCMIQKLTWGVGATPGSPLFPAGLVWDPKSRSIVLNGRPGHLQFFKTDDNKLLYNLDITGENYLAQERHKEMVNAEVSHVAISHDGKWMVTVETRDDKEAFFETLLKFWQYKFNARQFSLNTCIQRPHRGRVNTIKFQPPNCVPDHYLLVTTGTDCKFRIWVSTSKVIHSDGGGDGGGWVCESADSYRSLPAECAAFSSDGSVLGVTFGASLTLWDIEVCQLNTTLTRDNNKLKAMEFGSQECCHLVVTASESHLNVWSMLTLSVLWNVPLRSTLTLLCTDPLSSTMAVFTSDNSMYVFSPSNSKPLYVKRELSSSVVAAMFVPRPQKLTETSATWCTHSQLHFIDSNQELQYLELKSEQDPEQVQQWAAISTAPVTPFSVVVAEKSTVATERPQDATHIKFGTSANKAVSKLLSHPAHTMPHIQLFCASFLQALAVTRKTEDEMEQQKHESEEEVSKMEIDEDSDASTKVMDQVKSKKKFNKKLNKKNISSKGFQQSPKKEIKEIPSKKKQKRKPVRERKNTKKKENSFSIDDLNSDWLSVLENK